MLNIYDREYWRRFVAQSQTDLGKRIYSGRWDLIKKYITKGTVLDYGCGPGAFNSMGPEEYTKYNYDVNPYCGFTKLENITYDAVTMWDSIEHIPNFYGVLKQLNPTWLFLSTPNLESVKTPIVEWKHYRPHEHLYYFDRYSLSVILESLGYEIKETNFDEGYLRDPNNPEAIITVVATKK